MASLLRDPLFEISGRGPPPGGNYYHCAVTRSDVVWRWWKISPRAVDRHCRPGELREPHRDFLDNSELQDLTIKMHLGLNSPRLPNSIFEGEVSLVFGPHILQHAKDLCQGRFNYLEHLCDSLLLRIINYLELEDVARLGRASQKFRLLCGSEEFWEQAVRRRCQTITADVASLAPEVGWRRIFFTSKLQLQKLISRRRLKTGGQQRGLPSDAHVTEESPDTGLGSVTDVDLDSNHEPIGSDSAATAMGKLLQDSCVLGTATQNDARITDGVDGRVKTGGMFSSVKCFMNPVF